MNRCNRVVASWSSWLCQVVFVLALVGLAVSSKAQGWVDVTPSVPGPEASSRYATMVYHPVRQKVVLIYFERTLLQNGCIGGQLKAAEWDGSNWLQVGSSIAFPVCQDVMSGCWNPLSQKIVCLLTGGALVEWDPSGFVVGPPFSANPFFSGFSGLLCWDATRSELLLVAGGNGQNLQHTYKRVGGSWLYLGAWSGINLYGGHIFYDFATGKVCAAGDSPAFANTKVYFEWSGANWVQRYPGSIPLYMNSPVWSPALGASFGVAFMDAVPGGIVYAPRAFSVANGSYQQVFLTSWPSLRSFHLMAFDALRGRFVMHGGEFYNSSIGSVLMSDTWEYTPGPGAAYSTFGAGCLGSRGVPTLQPQSNALPRVNTPFTVQANNLPLTGPAFLFFGLSNTNYGPTPLPFDLAPVGAPGCNLAVSGDLLFGFPNILGVGTWTFTVPNQPGVVFYQQAFAFDPAANSLGLTVTNGGRGTVGN
jgi:hypothetical protein